MSSKDAAPRRKLIAGGSAIVLAIVGILLIAVACGSQKSPPKPSQAAQHPTATSSAAPRSSEPKAPAPTAHQHSQPSPSAKIPAPTSPAPQDNVAATPGLVLDRATPTAIAIPAIKVQSHLVDLGQNKDGTIEVPPLAKDSVAGWYHNSPTPGQLGPSVILGHVDSREYGPGIFFNLGKLNPGDTIDVTRSDQSTAVFRIDKVSQFSKTQFPTQEVYGNLDHPGLRLITCGGAFDSGARSYKDNIVVFASLVSSNKSS